MSATDFVTYNEDLYKNKKAEVLSRLKYVYDTFKTYGENDGTMDDHLMMTCMTNIHPIMAFWIRELNGRNSRGEQRGEWRMDLLKAFQEKYPDFEDEWSKNN